MSAPNGWARPGGDTFQVANAGLIEKVPLPTKSSDPGGITPGPDGNLWFIEPQGNRCGCLTPQGAPTEYPLSRTGNDPSDIISGPDGNLWFSDGHRIGHRTSAKHMP